MAQQVLSSWKRFAAGGIALAVAAAPMPGFAQTQPNVQAQAPAAPAQQRPNAAGGMLPAPAPPSTTFNPPPSPGPNVAQVQSAQGTQQAQQDLVGGHLEGKKGHRKRLAGPVVPLLGNGGLRGDIQSQGGLAHGGAAGQNNQVRLLKAAG